MSSLGWRRIHLAMADAAAGAHALSVAGANDRTRAQAVLVLKRAVQNVSNNFHVAVRVGGEPFAGRDPVFVDHAQGTKSHETRIVILVERKRVAGIEPAEIAATALIAASNVDHDKILVTTTISLRLDDGNHKGIQCPSATGAT